MTSSFTATGLVTNSDLANTSTSVNGQTCTLGGSCTATSAAGTLTGTTLNSTVVSSSLTSVGTIGAGTWNASVIGALYGGTGEAGTLTGVIYGNGTSAHTVATSAQVLSTISTGNITNTYPDNFQHYGKRPNLHTRRKLHSHWIDFRQRDCRHDDRAEWDEWRYSL